MTYSKETSVAFLLSVITLWGCGSEPRDAMQVSEATEESGAPMAAGLEQAKLVIDQRADSVAGRWYGEDEQLYLFLDLSDGEGEVRGVHVAGDHDGISVEGPDEGETTVTGRMNGNEATIEITVGPERDKSVTGVLRRDGTGLSWTMRHNAPDYNLIPARLALFPQRQSARSVTGRWYGETDDRHFLLELEERGNKIRGIHVVGDHYGILWEGADEGETTVSGVVKGDEATIEIVNGMERDLLVAGLLVREGDTLRWTMKNPAPEYCIIPESLSLRKVDPEHQHDPEAITAAFVAEAQATGGGIRSGQLYLKGLHLGMTLDEAASILDSLGMSPEREGPDGYRVTILPALDETLTEGIDEDEHGFASDVTTLPRAKPLLQLTTSRTASSNAGVWRVIATQDDRRVIQFYFSRMATNRLLGVEDVKDASHFIGMFTQAYGIPERRYGFALSEQADYEGSSEEASMYRDELNGWEIVFFDNKSFRLMAIEE